MQSKKNKTNLLLKWIKSKFKNSPLYGRTLIMLLFVALILKGFIIYFSYKNLDPRKNVISFLASDIVVVFIAHLLITINFWIKKRSLRLINDFIVFFILVIFIADIFTIFVFQSRVSVIDAVTLGSNGSSGFSGIVRLWMSVFIITGLVTFFLVQTKMPKSDKIGKNMVVFFSICTIFYAFFYISLIILNVKRYQVENIISLNLQKIFKTDSEGDIGDEIKDGDKIISYNDYITKVQGMGEDLNVIFVFAESLSAIDSANIGGKNNMPKFDEIQRSGITFTNFITNGKTSDTAHIATLYGVIPLVNIGANSTPYTGYKLLMQPLPEYLNSQGYKTTFISSVSLDFLNQRAFLSGAGFQKIIGEEEFNDKEKYTFEAAPDGDLYDRTLEEVQAQTGKYFIGLQTISFHTPYNSPYGKTEELALKYSDDELYRFYQGLQNIGFFDNGILVIVGDHRKMQPAEDFESEKFGENWYTRSVATVVGLGIQPETINSELIQHTDFYNSLKRLLGNGYVEVDKTYNDIFSNEINRNRGITSARYFENKNKYTVSILGKSGFTFGNISSFDKSKNGEIYNYLGSYANYQFGTTDTQQKGEKTLLIGHQGARNDAPENSLESFLLAKDQGANGIEFDISYTKDKVNIVAHGEHFYASNCEKFKVKNYGYDWIEKNCALKNGEKYLTLQNMLELIDGLFDYYFLEIKVYNEKLGEQQTLEAIQTVKDLNMQDKVIFISYSDTAREVLSSDPDIIFGRDTYDVNDLDFIGDNNSKYFLAPYDMMTPEVVEKAKSLGKEVATYTINETGNFQSMKDLGINIILTDDILTLKDYEESQYRMFKSSFPLEDFALKKSRKSVGGSCYSE